MIKRLLRLVGRWARKLVNHTSWVAVVTPTDRPKSVRNRCFIELFCGVVCVVTLPFWHFCWCRGFCHRTESDLFLFLFHSILKQMSWCRVTATPRRPQMKYGTCSSEMWVQNLRDHKVKVDRKVDFDNNVSS